MPKEVKVQFYSGASETYDGENNVASEITQGLAAQTPDLRVTVSQSDSETTTDYLNMRLVEKVTVTTTPDPQPEQEAAPDLNEQVVVTQSQPLQTGEQQEQESAGLGEPHPETEEQQDTEPDARTVAELKAALDKAKVNYPSDARKADLVELAKTNGV